MGKFNIHDWQAKQRQKHLNEQTDLPDPSMAFTGTGTFTPGQGGAPGTDGGIDVFGDQDVFQIGGDFGDPSGGMATFNPGEEIIYPSGWNPDVWLGTGNNHGLSDEMFDIDPTEHLSPLHYVAERYNIIYPKFTPATKGPKWLNMLAFKIYSFYYLLTNPFVIQHSQMLYSAAQGFNVEDEIDALNESKHLDLKFQMQRQELIPEFNAELSNAMGKKPTQDMAKRVGPQHMAMIQSINPKIRKNIKKLENKML